MRRHALSDLQLAPVLKIGRYARCSKSVATNLGFDSGCERSPANHAPDIRLEQGIGGQLTGSLVECPIFCASGRVSVTQIADPFRVKRNAFSAICEWLATVAKPRILPSRDACWAASNSFLSISSRFCSTGSPLIDFSARCRCPPNPIAPSIDRTKNPDSLSERSLNKAHFTFVRNWSAYRLGNQVGNQELASRFNSETQEKAAKWFHPYTAAGEGGTPRLQSFIISAKAPLKNVGMLASSSLRFKCPSRTTVTNFDNGCPPRFLMSKTIQSRAFTRVIVLA
jgi:hypothetical protein